MTAPLADTSPLFQAGSQRSRTTAWLPWAGLLLIAVAHWYSISISPPDRDMGHLQKIMYVHVPAAWNAMIAFLVVALASLRYLWKGTTKADLLAASAAEVGALLTGVTLLLGMLWGKPTWGVWWIWEPRLTSTAVLFFIFMAYLLLRAFVDEPDRRAQWSAVVGLFGALNVPIVYMSVRWWRTIHQVQSSPSTIDPAYTMGLRISAIATMFALLAFIQYRYHTAQLNAEADRIEDEASLLEGVSRA